ncbi:MAG: hypothetical protein KAY37_13065, partial [Phycisphaerae bacterium]|nr:hypothetical protein [Phycisphaerae bacterium]
VRGPAATFFSRLTAVCAAALFVAAAVAGPGSQSASAVDVQVLEDTPDRIVIQYRFDDFGETLVAVDGADYSRITLDGEPSLLIAGAPELPYLARGVTIPPDADSVTVRVDHRGSSFYEVERADVIPSKGILNRTLHPHPDEVPYTFGKEYETDAFFPGELADAREAYTLRDLRGTTILVFPFQYNPVSGILRVYTTLTVEVVPVVSDEAQTPDNAFERELSLAFHQLYKAHFINYAPDERYVPLDENGDLLIICHDAWLPNIQPLVNHKNAIGINTTAVGVSTIGNYPTSIKNYIQSVYYSSDLAFVLLVGDAAQVATPTMSGGSSDPSYSKLAGGDNYPDILVGRFSAETAAQVDTQVERTITYEQTSATQQDWFKRGTGIASNQGPGDDGEYDDEHIDNIRTDLLIYGYTVVDRIYDPNGTASQVSTALNAGRGIVNYCGHGSATSWGSTGFSNSHVNSLMNDNMLPFIISVACVNGQFSGYTCFAETWLRATHNSQPTGAIATYMSSINQSWNSPMAAQDEVNDLLVGEAYFSYGALCYAGSCLMMDEYGGDGVNMFNTWHVFGDPSVRVFGTAGPPTGLRVTPADGLESTGPTGGPFTPAGIDYTLENLNEEPIEYEVTKSVEWLSISVPTGMIPALGTTTVTVSLNAAAESLSDGRYGATVTFDNLTTYIGHTTRGVLLRVGTPHVAYEWTFDTNPGWAVQGQWAWGQPSGNGGQYGGPDPAGGYTGNNVYGYNLDGDYANNLSETNLTSTFFDCTGLVDVRLSFWRWLGVEEPFSDHAYIRVSADGLSWITIWGNNAEVADSSWTLQEFDLSSVADNQDRVYLRWTMGSTDNQARYCGWNIDDVQIRALATAGPVGACCHSDGSCTMDAQADCTGVWMGTALDCAMNPCPPPSGACCLDSGSCVVNTEADCRGVWLGAGTSCNPNPCPQPAGACCDYYGHCEQKTEEDCLADGGSYQGDETPCAPNPCPPPAVCRGDSNCDLAVDWRDIDYFVAAMNDNVTAWESMFVPDTPTCTFSNNDVNEDGTVSWRDIDPLIELMNTVCE